jgi:hypothetical protein
VLLGSAQNGEQFPRHVEQLLFSAYYWEKELGPDLVRKIWDVLVRFIGESDDWNKPGDSDNIEVQQYIDENGLKCVAMTKGTVTLWWTTGESACTLYETMPMRRKMAKGYVRIPNHPNPKAKAFAQSFISLSSETVLLCDVALIRAFHRFYLARHLKISKRPTNSWAKLGINRSMFLFIAF